jgi:Tfp pilus assembly protein PilO
MAEKNEEWHLSKSVPVTIIAVMVVQFAGAIWFFSTLDSSVSTNDRRIVSLENEVADIRATAQTQAVQLGRIEANLDSMKETLARIMVLLERANGG